MPLPRNLLGLRFGRLVVIKRSSIDSGGKRLWEVVCACGKTLLIRGTSLTTGNTRSCGCLNNEVRITTHMKHGHNRRGLTSREYRSWQAMLTRCTNKSNFNYPDYGGRGITICDRWIQSFPNFLMDMGLRPLGTTLDRIDNDKGYSPDNCRWATDLQQAHNRRPFKAKR